MYVEVPYITLTRHKAEVRPTNSMPQEQTRYSIHTTELEMERPDFGVSWGATFVGEHNFLNFFYLTVVLSTNFC